MGEEDRAIERAEMADARIDMAKNLKGCLALLDAIKASESTLRDDVDLTHVGECFEAAATCVAELSFHLQEAAMALTLEDLAPPSIEGGTDGRTDPLPDL
jgi:hypothetical protein